METILRSEEMAEIMLLPVRHHSPACARHIRRTIEHYRPDAVLIEGPENANGLLPVLVHPETKAPFAIYYSYYDKAGKISEEKEHYKCYYPFLDYSPELVALRTAERLRIPASFIDLSYGEILIACEEGKGLRAQQERRNYNDDRLLSQNVYLKKLCEKAELRSFDEFWEKFFEINDREKEDREWFDTLLLYCRQARENTSFEELKEEGCLARESHMAQRILSHARTIGKQGRVLVVTGGFHTPGLKSRIEDERSGKAKKEKKLPSAAGGEQGVYLMPYSMEAADALGGYASGMPFPGFYQQIWEAQEPAEDGENLLRPDEDPAEVPEMIDGAEKAARAYEKTTLDFLVSVGKEARKKEGSPTTYDEICAYQMAQGLAALRGKRSPGVYELWDAVLGSFVKGEYNLASNRPMQILKKQLTGDRIGELWEQADVPPLLQDFRKLCKSFGLKIAASLENESTLQIFSSQRHREISMFFHRLVFLDTGFAKLKKGPRLTEKKDRNLIREIWSYQWTVRVDAALIDASVYGATMEEAVTNQVKERLKEELHAGEAAKILAAVFEMGLTDQLQPIYEYVAERMQKDTDFYSLAEALRACLRLKEMAVLYRSELCFDSFLQIGVRKMVLLLPSMANIKDESLEECMNALKLLYQLTGREELGLFSEREELWHTLFEMQRNRKVHAGLNGCIHGLLYGGGREEASEVLSALKGYLTGTKEQMLMTASFFHGLFFAARDLLFSDDAFLKLLDGFLQTVGAEEFMELLPELRMAFAYFTPREIDKLARKVADLHQAGGEDLMQRENVLPQWYAYGRELEAYIGGQMKE